MRVLCALRLLITSGVMLARYDWLNKFYSFYMAAVVIILSYSIRLVCMKCFNDVMLYTVNGERFAGLNFHGFHGFGEYCESFSMNI